MPLTQLPLEVLEGIASHCGQADVISLAVACPTIADAVLPGIYRCIVIDAAPRPLHTERPLRLVRGRTMPCTVVHTIAGIKQCLEALAARPRFAAEVRSFVCRGNIAISDNVFLPLVATALANLDHLLELSWSACPELPPSLLAPLVQSRPPTLQVLSVDLAIRPGEPCPNLAFDSLRTLRVRPFLNAEVLAWVSRLAEASSELADIELGRFLDSKGEVGSSYRFVGLSDVHGGYEPVSAIREFFGRLRRDVRHKWQLRRLALSQTDTTSLDTACLSQAVDLSQLQTLVLTGSGHEDEPSHRVMAHITAAKPQLTSLVVDWRASSMSMASLFAGCCRRLESLTIHNRELPRECLETIAQTCATTLRELCVHIHGSFTLADLRPVGQLQQLEVLKLPFNHSVSSWELALDLPRLKVLELCLCNAATTPRSAVSSRAPNLGLLTSGILDAWNDNLPSPLQYGNILTAVSRHAQLCYVVIDGHTTCLRDEAAPLTSFMHSAHE